MDYFFNNLLREEKELREQIEFLKKRINTYPEGSLEVSFSHGRPQYYLRKRVDQSKRAKRIYIKKKEEAYAQALAQRDYDKYLLGELTQRLEAIQKVIDVYRNTNPENIADGFSKGKQKLLNLLILPDELYVKKWQEEEYVGKKFEEGSVDFFTARGERVRSKSEKIIADTLDRYKIPYKYECPLVLAGNVTVYPDFKVLNVRERKEYIWDHFGMMDNENYASNVVMKMQSYFNNGLFLADPLIITMETSKNPLNTRSIEKIIHKYLMGVCVEPGT